MLPAMAREPDDKTLMVRYRDGDVAAFQTLYLRHKGPLYRYFLRQGIGADQASELFQEVWIKIIRAKERYQPAAKFTTYMYKLAHNCLVDYFRHQGRQPHDVGHEASIDPAELPDNPGGNPEMVAEQKQSVECFRQALNDLPAEQRESFLLREERGRSLADIADVTGVNVETAKSRLRYAVGKLRQALRDREELTCPIIKKIRSSTNTWPGNRCYQTGTLNWIRNSRRGISMTGFSVRQSVQ